MLAARAVVREKLLHQPSITLIKGSYKLAITNIFEEMEELWRLPQTTGAGMETRGGSGKRMGGTTTCRRGAGDESDRWVNRAYKRYGPKGRWVVQ